MTISFFPNGVPQSLSCATEFFDQYEKASDGDLLALKEEFRFMPPEDMRQIDRFLLSNSRCDARLTTIICSGLPKIHNLDSEMIGYLLLESYKNYAADKYDQVTFEMNMMKLIDGFRPEYRSVILPMIHGCINSGNLADLSGIKKTKVLSIGSSLDKSIADQLKRSFVIGERYSVDAANMTASLASAIMPQSLGALLEILIANAETDLVRDLFQRLVSEDALFIEYVDSFADKLGHDLVLSVVKDTPFANSLRSATTISKKYGESAIFDKKDASIFDDLIEVGTFPSTLELALMDGFSAEVFPSMNKYLVDNLSKIYNCKFNENVRSGLKRFGLKNNCHKEVLSYEVSRLAKSFKLYSDIDLTAFNSTYIADKISKEYHNPDGRFVTQSYLELKDLIVEVGLDNSAEILKGVDGQLICDVMASVLDESDVRARNKFLRLYPQAKGALIENELGL